jgi:transcriptional regulator with XRE-family HTH domain
MILSDRLRAIREAKQQSLAEIADRVALTPSYLLRVEDGDTLPNIATLEKWAEALDVPLHRLFYDGEEPPSLHNLPGRLSADEVATVAMGNRAHDPSSRSCCRKSAIRGRQKA